MLCTMFSILVRPTGGTFVSDRAFGALFSSGGRRELILGAAEAYFALLTHAAPEDIKKKAENLHPKIRKHIRLFGEAAYRRDEIAHGVVMGTEIDENQNFSISSCLRSTRLKNTLQSLRPALTGQLIE